MTFIAPDIIAEAAHLSKGAAGFALLVGFLLWAFGWRWHRFWVVFAMTTAAGVVGLGAGQAAGGQVMAIGVLLAFAAGSMALELAKILAFTAGGVVAWLAVQAVIPDAREMWAVFLSGGLFGVVLYRLWTMLLTSFVGVLVSWHAAFTLAKALGSYDAVKWVSEHGAALNGGVIAATLLGVVMQVLTSEKPEVKDAENAEGEHDDESHGRGKKSRGDRHDDDHEGDRHREKSRKSSAPWWSRLPGLKAA